jgi:hypothetical protein
MVLLELDARDPGGDPDARPVHGLAKLPALTPRMVSPELELPAPALAGGRCAGPWRSSPVVPELVAELPCRQI